MDIAGGWGESTIEMLILLCEKGSRETSLGFHEDILGDKIGEIDVPTTCS